MKAMITNGATDTRAEADRLHQGVTEELRATTATGMSWVLVKVRVKAKKKSFQPKIRQNKPPTTIPGQGVGQDHPEKSLDGMTAVQHGHFVDLLGHVVEKVDHDPGGDGQQEGDINDDQAQDGVQQA